MKKIIFASMLAAGLCASASVYAAAYSDTVICAAPSTGSAGTDIPAGAAGVNFMMGAVKPKCSANVHLHITDGTNGAWLAVGSASVKGKQAFKAHTQGGSVAKNADCAIPGGCTAAEVTTAVGAANTEAAALAGST